MLLNAPAPCFWLITSNTHLRAHSVCRAHRCISRRRSTFPHARAHLQTANVNDVSCLMHARLPKTVRPQAHLRPAPSHCSPYRRQASLPEPWHLLARFRKSYPYTTARFMRAALKLSCPRSRNKRRNYRSHASDIWPALDPASSPQRPEPKTANC